MLQPTMSRSSSLSHHASLRMRLPMPGLTFRPWISLVYLRAHAGRRPKSRDRDGRKSDGKRPRGYPACPACPTKDGQASVSRIMDNGTMCRPMLVLCFLLLLSCPTAPLSAQVLFDGVGSDYVPEGKPKKQSRLSTVDQCQAACAVKDGCKAYAFRTSRPACYFYSQVHMGGTPLTREMGMYSSGLSIVPKKGFVFAFKRSSFPTPPVFEQRPE